MREEVSARVFASVLEGLGVWGLRGIGYTV